VIKSIEQLIPTGIAHWPDHSIREWNRLNKLNDTRVRNVNDLNRVIQNMREILAIDLEQEDDH
jgi:hypothetical protein